MPQRRDRFEWSLQMTDLLLAAMVQKNEDISQNMQSEQLPNALTYS